MPDKRTPEQRFWVKVDKRGPDECWPWLAAKNASGYGQFYFNGRTGPAHRASWEIEHDQRFPEGLFALHRCNNPTCVNPTHIYPGTRGDNLNDLYATGWVPHHARKRYCVNGHLLEGENIIPLVPRPKQSHAGRRCRLCRRDQVRAWRAKQRALAASSSPTERTA